RALGPAEATVLRPEDATVGRLDEGEGTIRARRRDRDRDLPQDAFRQPAVARDLGPGVATVDRLDDAASLAAADELVRTADRLPQGRVHDPRIQRIDREVDAAGPGPSREGLLPGLPAVPGAEDAAHRVRTMRMPEGRDVRGIGILGVDPDLADVAGVLEPEVGPGLAAVGGAVDTVAVRDVATDAGLAHPGIDDVRVGCGHPDRADPRPLE